MRKNLSGKGKKKKKKKRPRNRTLSQQPRVDNDAIFPQDGVSWMEGDGLHALLPGEKPSKEQLEKMTELYQRQLRKSPLFKQWVKQYGKHKTIEMLQECRVVLR